MRKLYCVLLFLCGVTLAVHSQTQYSQTIRGKVIDSKTEMPLPGATVQMPGTNPLIGTISDLDGNFRLEKILIGRVDLLISYVGYNPIMLQNLVLSSGKELVLSVALEELVMQLDGVIAKANMRKDQPISEMALVSARSFTIEETERYAGSLGDPSRMAANYAGVSSASDQRNDIIIRGNSPIGLLWRLDGVDIPNPNHFGSMGSTGGPVSILNNNVLANSDFFTGAFPAEFGNALAGAFDLRMRNGNNQQHEFMGQIGFNGFETGAEGPISRQAGSSYLLNFRYSTLEVFNKLGINVGTGFAIPQYKDLSFKVNLPTQKFGRFTLFGIGGLSYIEMLDSKGDSAAFGFSGTDLYFGSDMGVCGLSHTYFLTSNSRIATSLAVSGIRNSTKIKLLEDEYDFPNIKENSSEIKFIASTKYSHKFSARNHLNVGMVFEGLKMNYNGKIYDDELAKYLFYLDNKGFIDHVRVFAEWQHKFADNLTLSSGLHSHLMFLNNSWSFEPRTSFRWQANPNNAFSIGAGMHSQTQPQAIYFLRKLVDTINNKYVLSNQDLDLSRSLHLVAGYDRLLGEKLRMKIETYYQHLYNLPVAEERPEYSSILTGGSYGYWVYHYLENKGTGRNYGVEFTLEKFLNQGFYYLFTASLFDATYKGWDGVERNSAFNNNYVFNALAGYEWTIKKRNVLAVDVKGMLAGGVRYIPINVEKSAIKNEAVYEWDKAFDERYNDYFRVNVRVTYRLNGRKLNQEWALDLQNLTNHKNIFMQTWNSYSRKLTTNYQMAFMPMMTYRVQF
ncbi:MAG: TonB-dependent receptor [Bacteroidales bacterium]|nr:TonB-dependent receptor [Bacteroidales bacterium]